MSFSGHSYESPTSTTSSLPSSTKRLRDNDDDEFENSHHAKVPRLSQSDGVVSYASALDENITFTQDAAHSSLSSSAVSTTSDIVQDRASFPSIPYNEVVVADVYVPMASAPVAAASTIFTIPEATTTMNSVSSVSFTNPSANNHLYGHVESIHLGPTSGSISQESITSSTSTFSSAAGELALNHPMTPQHHHQVPRPTQASPDSIAVASIISSMPHPEYSYDTLPLQHRLSGSPRNGFAIAEAVVENHHAPNHNSTSNDHMSELDVLATLSFDLSRAPDPHNNTHDDISQSLNGTNNSFSGRIPSKHTPMMSSANLSEDEGSESVSLRSPSRRTQSPVRSLMRTSSPKRARNAASAKAAVRAGTATWRIPHQAEQPNTQLKPCNCKNSRCLKLYCECFRARVFCNGCNCIDCFNDSDHVMQVYASVANAIERNPDAFSPRITSKDSLVEEPLRHSRGCKCSKTGCRKNYCECFAAGIRCSDLCKCIDCRNVGPPGSSTRKAKAAAEDSVESVKAPVVAVPVPNPHLNAATTSASVRKVIEQHTAMIDKVKYINSGKPHGVSPLTTPTVPTTKPPQPLRSRDGFLRPQTRQLRMLLKNLSTPRLMQLASRLLSISADAIDFDIDDDSVNISVDPASLQAVAAAVTIPPQSLPHAPIPTTGSASIASGPIPSIPTNQRIAISEKEEQRILVELVDFLKQLNEADLGV